MTDFEDFGAYSVVPLEIRNLVLEGIAHLLQSTPDTGWVEDERRSARKCFEAAAEALPQLPWLWYQVGWLTIAPTDDHSDEQIASARSAFEKALDAAPDNVPAHLGLAYLDWRYGPPMPRTGLPVASATSEPSWPSPDQVADFLARKRPAAWNGTCGAHLRAVLNPTVGLEAALVSAHPFDDDTLLVYYHVTQPDLDRFLNQLDTLGEVLPEEQRNAYYMEIATLLINFRGYDDWQAQRWYMQAVRWHPATADEGADAYLCLAESYADAPEPDYVAACNAMAEAHRYLLRAEVIRSNVWATTMARLANRWQPPDDKLATFLQLCHTSLEMERSGAFSGFGEFSGYPTARIAEAAGVAAARQNNHTLVAYYLERAQQIDPMSPRAAEGLAKVYIVQERWDDALHQVKWLIELDVNNSESGYYRRLLETIVALKQPWRTLQPVMTDMRDLLGDVAAELRWQREMLEKVQDTQRRAESRLADESKDRDKLLRESMAELHNLVQEGSRVQPSALTRARKDLIFDLGEGIFGGLCDEAKDTLVLAEVLYNAMSDLGNKDQGGPPIIEYAITVELEMHRLMRHLPQDLDRECDDRFSLGGVNRLLKAAVKGQNPVVYEYLFHDLGIALNQMRHFQADLERITYDYRNKAAHVGGLTRQQATAFRALLISNGFIAQVVQMNQRAAKIA